MSRVRVMHVVVAGEIGGAERLLVDLASRPEATGADHQIALLTPNPALHRYLLGAEVPVHYRPAREGPLAYLWSSLGPSHVAWLAARIAAARADVVHTHTLGSHVVGTRAARRTGRPQLRTEHHVMHYTDPSSSAFTRWAASRTQRFVAVSEYVRRTITRRVPELAARAVVVRNGVDTHYWSPRPAPHDRPFRVAIVCRLTAWKRVHLAVMAAARAGVELVVVGDGEERGPLEALARAHGGRARFVGHQADPRPFIAECDATLTMSEDEPLGLSVLESLAMARAVLGYAGGGVPEIVGDDTGILVHAPTAEALAGAITRARADRDHLRTLGENGRRFVLEGCGIERTCAGYAAEYRGLAERR